MDSAPSHNRRSNETAARLWPRVGIGVNLIGLCVLCLMVSTSPKHLLYDEPAQIETVQLIQIHGWRYALLQTTSASGPLYSAIHLAVSSLTQLRAPMARVVNVLAFFAVILLIAKLLSERNCSYPLWQASSLVAIPFLWPPVGMALTELPALMFFSAWAMLAHRLTQDSDVAGAKGLGTAAIAAACLGCACLGRQTYVVVLPVIAVLAIRNQREAHLWLLQAAAPILCLAPLFILWHGTMPPRAVAAGGVSVEHGLLSLAYAGIASAILAPRWYSVRSKSWTVATMSLVIIGVLMPVQSFVPARTLAEHWLAAPLLVAYTRVASGLLVGIGLIWLSRVIIQIYQQWRDTGTLLVTAAVVCVALTPLLISHQFSSRYIATAAALFPVLVASNMRPSLWTSLRTLGGVGLGAATLYSYYASG